MTTQSQDEAEKSLGPRSLPPTCFRCPACGWSGEFDYRFTAWCENCGHGADTSAPDRLSPRAARRRERSRAAALAQQRALIAAPQLRPTTSAGIAVTVLATVVHLVTVLLVVGSIMLVLTHPHWFVAWITGLIGLCAAWVVRPRFAYQKRKNTKGWLTREQTPAFFALLDRCAGGLGAPVPQQVRFVDAFNAGTFRIGLLRGHAGMRVGAPLWVVLSGQERIALLGHELGHQINGDVSHGLWANSAQASLAEWVKLVNPRFRRARRGSRAYGLAAVADLIAPYFLFVVCIIPFLLVLGSLRGLRRLDLSSGQRAEYLADELGSRIGSSAALIGLLDKLALRASVTHYLTLKANQRSTEDPWPGLREYVETIPGHEKRRRVFVEVAQHTRIDSSHPANYLRRDLVRARPQQPAAVVLGQAEWAAIDAELQPSLDRIARKVLRLRGGQSISRAAGQRAVGPVSAQDRRGPVRGVRAEQGEGVEVRRQPADRVDVRDRLDAVGDDEDVQPVHVVHSECCHRTPMRRPGDRLHPVPRRHRT
ncbi:MAG TPA: M48 family metallopeptidase [Actinocrinis sp.]|nr:M48 family metallopeptidase [Actinocrinis sp.]